MLILAVDDEPVALRKIERTIKTIYQDRADVTVLTADNYIDALACGRGKPDIAFLDVEMLEMTGIELGQRLLKMNPRLNIIFVTAYDDFARDAYSLHASGYITKPYMIDDVVNELQNLRFSLNEDVPLQDGSQIKNAVQKKLKIQCFGNFEVFSNGKPLHFQRRGAKEILAYLISLKGASASRLEICTAMWETAEEIEQKKDYFRTLIASLRRTLKDYDAEEVLVTSRDSFAVNTAVLDCDYYRYLTGDRSAQQQYMGMFMQQYPWAEELNAMLSGRMY